MKTKTILTAILILLTSLSVWAQNPDERVPQKDAAQEFPRWLRQIHVDGFWLIGQTTTDDSKVVGAWTPSIAVDAENVTHIVYSGWTKNQYTGALFPDIYYVHNRYKTRRANSWSPPLNVSSTPGISTEPDIYIDNATGTAHVVWVEGGVINYNTVTYSDAGGAAAGTVQATNMTNHKQPAITIDGGGGLHIVATNKGLSQIDYVSTVGGTPAMVTGSNPGERPRVHFDSNGNPNVAWVDLTNGYARYNVHNGTAWLAGFTVSQTSAPADAVQNVDLFVGSDDKIHFAWDDTTPATDRIRYSATTTTSPGTPTFTTIENVSTTGNSYMPRIVVDSRLQPHINWVVTGGVSYAAKVNHATAGWTWGRQEATSTITKEPFARLEICINENDNIYLTFDMKDAYDTGHGTTYGIGGLIDGGSGIMDGQGDPGDPPVDEERDFTWTHRGAVFSSKVIEFNLSSQDSYGLYSMGPLAVANAGNGNMYSTLPLFSAPAGHGFGTSMALIHNAHEWDSGVMSQGWMHNYQITMTDHENEDIISLQFGDGRTIVYWKSVGSWTEQIAEKEFAEFSEWTDADTLVTKHGITYDFDPSTGKLDTITDTNSNTFSFAYTANVHLMHGHLNKVTDSVSRETTFTYTGGQLTKITDPKLNTYTINYTSGKVSSVVFDGGPITWSFEYFSAHNVTNGDRKNLIKKITTPNNNATQFWYFQDNRFKESQDPTLTQASIGTHDKRKFTFTSPTSPTALNPMGATYIDRRGNAWRILYQYMRSLITEVKDPNNVALTREFDGEYRNLTKITDRLGSSWEYTYRHEDTPVNYYETPDFVRDLLWQVKEPGADADPGSAPSGPPTATYTYTNNIFRVRTLTDANNQTTAYHYDNDSQNSYDPAKTLSNDYGNVTEIDYPTISGGTMPREQFVNNSDGSVWKHLTPRNVDSGGYTEFIYGGSGAQMVSTIYRPYHAKGESMLYDVMGNMTNHTQPEGGTKVTVYNNLYRVTSQTAPTGDVSSSVSYVYDNNGNVDTITGPGSAFVDNTYDELGRIIKTETKLTSAVTIDSTVKYDSEGNTRESKDPRGKTTTMTYDNVGRLDIETRPGSPGPSIVTDFDYDAGGNVIQQITGASISYFSYTARGQLKKSTQAGGGLEEDTNTYNPDGTLNQSLHKVNGAAVSGSTNSYDERQRLKQVTQLTDPGAGTGIDIKYETDKNGNRTKVIQVIPGGTDRESSFVFDLSDRQTQSKDHDGIVLSEIIYNDNDLRVSVKTAHPESGSLVTSMTFTYNDRNELKTETDSFGATTTYSYDAQGNMTTKQLPDVGSQSCVIAFAYDFAGRLLSQTHDPGAGANEIKWEYEYDENGNRTKILDPRGKIYNHVYDDAGRLLELHYPQVSGANFVESWGFDNRGNTVSHIDPEGKITQFTYDVRDRLTHETHTKAGVILADIVQEYDLEGNLLTVRDLISKIMISFTKSNGAPAYDEVGRLLQVRWFLEVGTPDQVMWKEIQYMDSGGNSGYDDAGNLTDMLDPEGHRFEYEYDNHNRMTKIKRTPDGGSATDIATFVYYVSGLRKSVTLDGGLKQSFHYDKKSRLTSIQTTDSEGAVKAKFFYEYDLRDRRTRVTLDHLVTDIDYTYDCHDRLTQEDWSGNSGGAPTCSNSTSSPTLGNLSAYSAVSSGTPNTATYSTVPSYTATFTYDKNGNRLSKAITGGTTTTYAYDDQNRLTVETIGATTYDYLYDKNGNQIERKLDTGNVETYVYDYMNRMSGYMDGTTADPDADAAWSYRYTPTGERLAKIDDQGASNQEEWFMYDGDDATADYTRSSGSSTYTLDRTYVNGRAIDSKIARVDDGAPEVMYYYLGDAIGTAHELADTSGNVVRQVLYTAWGEDLPGFSPDTNPADRHGLTQRERDDESGLMYFRAREYDPSAGRFVQADPWGSNRILESYLYTRNSPPNGSDPLGLFNTKPHEDITREALKFWYNEDAQVVTVVSNWTVDLASVPAARKIFEGQIGRPFTKSEIAFYNSYHFDDLRSTKEIEDRWEKLDLDFRNAINRSKEQKHAPEMFLGYLGYTLHAVQDFYSHSNYVDRAVQLELYKPDAIPSWEKFKQDYPRLAKNNKMFFTGAYSRPRRGNQPHHDTLNKDSATDSETNGDYHKYAKRAAIAGSIVWKGKFEILLGADLAKKVQKLKLFKVASENYKKMHDMAARSSKLAGKWN